MWLLITFITVWALSPGPVAVMTLHETRKYGLMAGIAVSTGATVTSALMVIAALIVQTVGISAIIEQDGMLVIERVGAFAIILMGLYAGYKSLWFNGPEVTKVTAESSTRYGFIQGMMVMGTYIPQALLYYNIIVPGTVETASIIPTIIVLGSLKLTMMFGWHSAIAFFASRTRRWAGHNRVGKFFEIATACLIVGLGVNILF